MPYASLKESSLEIEGWVLSAFKAEREEIFTALLKSSLASICFASLMRWTILWGWQNGFKPPIFSKWYTGVVSLLYDGMAIELIAPSTL